MAIPALGAALAPALGRAATAGLTLALFLTGAGLSAKALRAVGWRPLLQGVLLWLFISVVSPLSHRMTWCVLNLVIRLGASELP